MADSSPPEPTPAARAGASRWRVFLRDAAGVVLLDTLVAGVLTLFVLSATPVADAGRRWWLLCAELVYSQAIGLAIFGLVEWPRLTWWWGRPPRRAVLACVTALAVPVGYLAGSALASVVLGLPLQPLVRPNAAVLGAVVVTIAASVVAVFVITQHERLAAERLRAEAADARATSARLQLLQQQIEPHMLFNTIANAHALIEDEPARAQRMLEAMSALLQASMHLNQAPFVGLGQELELVEHYLKLMAMRMGGRLRYTIELPPELAAVRIPPLAVQPLVENAVKHGLDPQPGGGTVRVQARREGDRVLVIVADDGRGLQVDDPFAGGRIGLDNVRKRLAGAFGDAAGLALVPDIPRGVRATLTLPG